MDLPYIVLKEEVKADIVFFCCFQLWPLFPSDRLVRCSAESDTNGALKTMLLFEVVKLLFG